MEIDTPTIMNQTLADDEIRLTAIFPEFQVKQSPEAWRGITLQIPDAGVVSVKRQRGHKWHFSGGWPSDSERHTYYPDNGPSINIAISKTNDQIRKDYIHRFHSEYVRLYAEQVAKAKKNDEDTASRRKTIQELCKLTGSDYDAERYPDRIFTYSYGIHELAVNNDGTEASIHIRYVPIGVVKEIIKHLKTLVPKKP